MKTHIENIKYILLTLSLFVASTTHAAQNDYHSVHINIWVDTAFAEYYGDDAAERANYLFDGGAGLITWQNSNITFSKEAVQFVPTGREFIIGNRGPTRPRDPFIYDPLANTTTSGLDHSGQGTWRTRTAQWWKNKMADFFGSTTAGNNNYFELNVLFTRQPAANFVVGQADTESDTDLDLVFGSLHTTRANLFVIDAIPSRGWECENYEGTGGDSNTGCDDPLPPKQFDDYSIVKVLAHEMSHTLGVNHISITNDGNTYFNGWCTFPDRQLMCRNGQEWAVLDPNSRGSMQNYLDTHLLK